MLEVPVSLGHAVPAYHVLDQLWLRQVWPLHLPVDRSSFRQHFDGCHRRPDSTLCNHSNRETIQK